jgi:hypothetical protein
LIVLSLPLLERPFPDIKGLIRLGQTPPAVVAGESYFLYLLKHRFVAEKSAEAPGPQAPTSPRPFSSPSDSETAGPRL